MGNIISRRDFLIRQMGKEYPNKDLTDINIAIIELEHEYPEMDLDEKVYYDTGKPVNKAKLAKPGPRSAGRSKADSGGKEA